MSINNKKWVYLPQKSKNLIEQLLLNRNIQSDHWADFLKPDFDNNLHDPFLLLDMAKAVKRIDKAIENKEIVGIFADYDADGIPASVVLAEVLEKHDLKIIIYIPRREEGYGLSRNGLDQFKKDNVTLLITVDLGIREVENINYANSLGFDCIVTDHHEPGDTLPQALAVINPKRKNSKYPFRELSGGGVVYKLAQALSQKLLKLTQNDLKWMLDLVSITTICDVVPLVDENRIFAKYGLIVLAKTKRLGLKKLYQVSEIDSQNISTYTVGFQIGPRINAPGRLNQENESLNLLRTKNENTATRLALKLDEINKQRQNDLESILKEARSRVLIQKLNEKKVICLWDKDWSTGLIGLVAGKLTEEFSRPTIILSQGETLAKGSARSVDNFDIVDVLTEIKDLLENFGGHSKAAGLTINNNNLSLMYDRILSIADTKLDFTDLFPKINIDMVLETSQLKLDLIDQLKQMEPFGLANPRPIFSLNKVRASQVRQLGSDGKHLKFLVEGVESIAFNMGYMINDVVDYEIDLAFNVDENIWNDNRKFQIKVLDIKFNK